MTPAESAARLVAAIDEATKLFEQAHESQTTVRLRPGGWCAREILGHLIDSACNNHRRFIVGQSPETTRFDGYEQDAWVSRQQYDRVPWHHLTTLWTGYNRHLAHVMTCVPEDVALRAATAPNGAGSVTIAFLMEDYVVHLRHHLEQLRALLASQARTQAGR